MDPKTYETLKQCSNAENIPIAWLKSAKNVFNAPGFRGTRIDWHILKPWLDEHQEEIENNAELTKEQITVNNLLKDGVLKDLEIQKRRGEYLDPKEVREFLKSISLAQCAVLKRFCAELPPRLVGKSQPDIEAEITKAVTEVINLFKNADFDKWTQQ